MSKAGISYNMQIKGMDKLVAGLLERAKMDVVKQIIKQQTAQLQARSKQMTGTVYAHPTGATKRGIMLSFETGGLTGIVGMSMEYNPYTERGTRFMRARPVLKPAFLYQKVQFINQLKQAAK
ncbi:HK97-gp10 family putative phage morphogenesis protein [Lacticaseibacillus paracasei]|uniref:HK97-gp10 family putative phage morphogenesis protein n=1 Tax=Lacticaseibacillus paracasei TaxID=1597 RepID=UPI0031F6637E